MLETLMHLKPPLFIHVLVLVMCICHCHRSSQACSLIEKKIVSSIYKKRAYLRLKTLMHLEAPLFVQVLVLVVCVCHRCHSLHTCSLVVKKNVSRAKKKLKKKELTWCSRCICILSPLSLSLMVVALYFLFCKCSLIINSC